MRLYPMRFVLKTALAASLLVSSAGLYAQATAGQPPFTPFRDQSLLKPPAGHPVAIMEFEDLECPACAHAFPIVHTAVDHYKIPLLRYDFPLQMHIWSRDAAITARYLQDKVSPDAATQFRRDTFANQQSIASKDDLNNYTRHWFEAHKLQMPFVMDPSGLFAAEVQADYRMGERLGLIHTPTIVVLGPKGYTEVTDVSQLYTVIDTAEADVPKSPAKSATTGGAHNNMRKPKPSQQ